MVLPQSVDIANLTVLASSVAVGAVAALLLQGKFRWLLAGAQLAFGAGMRDMKMVMVVRSDLQMGRNKAAALCSHAALNCYKRALSDIPDITKKWERSGQTKVVVKIPGEQEIMTLARAAQNEGFDVLVQQVDKFVTNIGGLIAEFLFEGFDVLVQQVDKFVTNIGGLIAEFLFEGLVAVMVHDDTPLLVNTPSVLGIGPGPAKLIDKVAGHLKLY